MRGMGSRLATRGRGAVLALALPLALAACVAPPTAEGEPTAAIELPARWSAPAPE
mgnify:CR=1 FL=1